MRRTKNKFKKTVNKPIEYEDEPPTEKPKQEPTKGNFPPYELNPRIQRMKEKEKKICKLIENAF